MKKILSLLLIFTLAVTFFGLSSQEVKADGATEDVTIYLHIHQYDGDYTNSGTGLWDGVNWNNWADVVSSTDSFGGVIEKTYTAAEINAAGIDGGNMFEFKPTRDVNVDDAANYLGAASAEGKVFADVSSLKDGSATELHLYFVEGALDFYVPTDGFGLLFFVYVDPKIAADEAAYDAWNMWTWNNGTNGSVDGTDFALDMELMAGDYIVPAKLGVFEVAADADQDSGFIVRTEDWAKQCGTDIMIDNTAVRGSGAMVYYYKAESCELETDYAAYNADIAAKYEMNAGNRFLEGTEVTSPSTINVELLMPKNPGAYEVGRFTVKDMDGNVVPILSVDASTTGDLGAFTSDVTCAVGEYKLILYVDSTLDHAKLGLVGSLQGWNIDALIMSTKDDVNGNAVFEACSSSAMGEFKVKYDLDGDGFTWDGQVDPEVTPANQAFNLSDGMMGIYYIMVSDIQVGSFDTALVLSETEKHFIVYVDTDVPFAQLGIAGDFQGWAPDQAVAALGVDVKSGYTIFEFKSATPNAQFVILNDADANGWSWDDAKINVAGDYFADMGDNLVQTLMIDVAGDMVSVVPMGLQAMEVTAADYTYTSTTTCTSPENMLTLFLDTDLDYTKLGLVGSLQGWSDTGAIPAIGETDGGLVVFEHCTTDAAGEFKVLFDNDDSGFNWGDQEVTPNNLAFNFGDGATDAAKAYKVYGTDTMFDAYTPTLVPETVNFNRFMVYVKTDIPFAQLGIAGDFQGWDPANAIPAVGTDNYGHVIFEFRTTRTSTPFVIINDLDGDGWSWDGATDPKINGAGGDYSMDLGDATSQMYYVDATTDERQVVTVGSMLEKLDTTMVTLNFAPDTLMFGNAYTVAFEDKLPDPNMPKYWSAWYGDQWSGYTQSSIMVDEMQLVVDVAYETAPAATYATQVFQENFMVENGKFYRISFDAKADAAKDILVAFGDALDNDPWFTDFVAKTTKSITTDWATYTIEFEMTQPTTEDQGKLVFELATAVETKVYFDNIMIEEITALAGTVVPDTNKVMNGEFEEEALVIMTEMAIPFNTSNNFVPGDGIVKTGTYAKTPMTIAVKFENPTTFIDSLELVDGDGNIIPIDMVKYTRGGIGTFTPTVTCEVGKDKLTVHLKNSTNVNGFQQLGLVGSVQGWNPDAAVNPTGIDSKGNFVFEVCVDTTTDEQAFKILYEGELDSGFAWGDPELTPGDVLFTFDGDVTLYVEEGNSVAGSVYQTIMLLDANKLDVTKEYMLQFVDENGFVVYLELDIDNEAPVITPTIKPDVPFEINSDETFDLMDYFNVINVIDNRDGEMMYEIVQTLDLSVAGEQTVIIKAVDAWMNEATKSFVFTVIDVEFPVLTLTVTELTLTVGDEIPTWSDYATTTEGTITIDVSQVDLTTAGTFFVKFTAEDAAGNKDTESIEVTVELGEEVDDSPLSGCFSSIGNSFVVYLAGVIALIGGAGLFFIKRH